MFHVVDLTMQDEDANSRSHVPTPPEIIFTDERTNVADEERTPVASSTSHPRSLSGAGSPLVVEETELQTRPNSLADTANGNGSGNFVKRKTSQLLDMFSVAGSQKSTRPMPPKLAALIQAYVDSDIAAEIQAEIDDFHNGQNGGAQATGELRDVVGETEVLRSRSRASWGTQFTILSGRAFKNLYRDPALLTAHYVSSIVIALLCGGLFNNVTYAYFISFSSCFLTDIHPGTISQDSKTDLVRTRLTCGLLPFLTLNRSLLLHFGSLWILMPLELGPLCQ